MEGNMSGSSTTEASHEHTPRAAATHETRTPVETRGRRLRRKARRGRLHLSAIIAVALLLCVVALAVSNTSRVRVHWVLGSGSASLVWIVVLAALLGWLMGMATGSVFRWRTRAPRASRGDR
jgi:uncharacterized integral membrane protein